MRSILPPHVVDEVIATQSPEVAASLIAEFALRGFLVGPMNADEQSAKLADVAAALATLPSTPETDAAIAKIQAAQAKASKATKG